MNEQELLKLCDNPACRNGIKELFKENGEMESDLIVWELGVADLLDQCPTCEFRFTDKLS